MLNASRKSCPQETCESTPILIPRQSDTSDPSDLFLSSSPSKSDSRTHPFPSQSILVLWSSNRCNGCIVVNVNANVTAANRHLTKQRGSRDSLMTPRFFGAAPRCGKHSVVYCRVSYELQSCRTADEWLL